MLLNLLLFLMLVGCWGSKNVLVPINDYRLETLKINCSKIVVENKSSKHGVKIDNTGEINVGILTKRLLNQYILASNKGVNNKLLNVVIESAELFNNKEDVRLYLKLNAIFNKSKDGSIMIKYSEILNLPTNLTVGQRFDYLSKWLNNHIKYTIKALHQEIRTKLSNWIDKSHHSSGRLASSPTDSTLQTGTKNPMWYVDDKVSSIEKF